MRPSRENEDALVDLIDVILVEGVMLQADVIISVADIPLIGLQLRAALAGMTTMTEYGFFREWDYRHRERALKAEETARGPSRGLSRGDRVALEASKSTSASKSKSTAGPESAPNTRETDESTTEEDATTEIDSSSDTADSSPDSPEN